MTIRRRLVERWHALRSDDSGMALILALLTVLVVGAMLAAVLHYQGTGFTLAPRMQIDRNEANYLQGSVEGAVNNIRGSSDAGAVGKSCPSFTPTSAGGLSGVDGKSFRVDCTPMASPLGGPGTDSPAYAIHTLGTGADEGVFVTGNNPLFVNGPVYSNGLVSVDNQTMNLLRVNGSLNAVGACTGAIRTTDVAGPRCSPPLFGAGNPGYLPALNGQPALEAMIAAGPDDRSADPVPTCSGDRIVFSPGYYGTRPDLLKARFGCGGRLWEFQPGTYYFDYEGTWEIKGYQVVGGAVVAGHSASTALGAACTASASPGVQFVFGGSGTITTTSSTGGTISGIELCGPPTSTASAPQRIVLYGLSDLNTSTTTETAAGPLTKTATSGPAPSPGSAWLTPAGARSIDTTTSATTVGVTPAFTENKTASLAYTMPADLVPKGAKVSAVSVRVAHTLVNAAGKLTIDGPRIDPITVAPGDTCPSSSPCTFDLMPGLAAAGTEDVVWRVLRSLSVTFAATADKDTGPPGTVVPHSAVVDGVDVQVTYTTPTYRQQTCVAGCTFFDSRNNPNVFMHGTVDTALAGWRVNVHNTGRSIFDRGVIIRTIDILVGASSKQTDSPFQLPGGPASGRYVYFRGYVDGVEKLRACVLYTDTGPTPRGTTTAYFGYRVEVKHWLFMRSTSSQGSSC